MANGGGGQVGVILDGVHVEGGNQCTVTSPFLTILNSCQSPTIMGRGLSFY